MAKLTATWVRAAKEPGKFHDGFGLYLRIRPSGSKYFAQRITIRGKRHELGIERWPVITLQEARDVAIDNLRAIRKGDSPLQATRGGIPTMREALDAFLQIHGPTWRGAQTEIQWKSNFRRYVFPTLGERRVDSIVVADCLDVLQPIWLKFPRVARNVKNRLSMIMQWSIATGYRQPGDNPVDAAMSVLPKDGNGVKHRAALPYREVGSAFSAVGALTGRPGVVLALKLVMLTVVRSQEARCATWTEIDMDTATWTVPAERMKAGKEHRVPLSDAALAVLEEARKLPTNRANLVFPSTRGKQLNDHALSNTLLRDLKVAGTVHGFRSSFRDWCAETGKPRELAEAALAHVVGGTEGAYFRSTLFDQRRELMQEWAKQVTH